MINHCQFIDLGYKGNKYTWLNKRYKSRNALIFERLDRFMATDELISSYPDAQSTHLPCTHSDHCPLLLSIFKDDPILHKKFFRFEKIWTTYPDFINMVSNIWENKPPLTHAVKTFEREVSVRACKNVGNIF